MLNLSEDVAGATFMASGTSTPELFSAIFDTFYSKNGVGAGTVVGSVVFNILVMIGGSGIILGPRILRVDWRPILRDLIFYGLTIILFVVTLLDLEVTWTESLFYIILYALYILAMKFNPTILLLMDKYITPLCYVTSLHASVTELPEIQNDQESGSMKTKSNETPEQTAHEISSPWAWPPTKLKQAFHIIVFPILLASWITIPNLKNWNKRMWPVTFTVSVIWLMIWVSIMVEIATIAGCIIQLKPVVMGLTVLAVGTSFPDLMSSLFAARGGHGDMAVANTLGSNIFDILVGLGLPWILSSIVNVGKPIFLLETGLQAQFVCMGISYFITILALWRFELHRKMGVFLCSFYLLYLIYIGLHSYHIILW